METPLATAAPAAGTVPPEPLPTKVASDQGPFATEILTEPAVKTLVTKRDNTALDTFDDWVPEGSVDKSNCTKPWLVVAPPTETVVPPPWGVAPPETTKVSCRSGTV